MNGMAARFCAGLLVVAAVFTACGSDQAGLAIGPGAVNASVRVQQLRCEYLKDPMGIDVLKPRLSWQLVSTLRGQKQAAYQLLVASSRDQLEKNVGDLWDSGKVESDQSIHVEYAGKPLASRLRCFWKVRVWDKENKASQWSKAARWSMGLLKSEDWTAKWITHPSPKRLSHPWLRRTFDVQDEVKRAVLYVNTPSFNVVHINRKKVTPYVLTPGVSQIDKRLFVYAYDVTPLLVKGKNCMAVWMSPGWHQALDRTGFTAPILRAQLEVFSRTGRSVITTDKTWRIKESCISQIGEWKWSNFGGELYDARTFEPGWDRTDLDDGEWLAAREIPGPAVIHSWQPCESAKTSSPILPKRIDQHKNGKWVIDFGRPLTGWMRLRMHDLKAGQRVTIYYADVDDNGRKRKLAHKVNRDGFQTFSQTDVFISAGTGTETFCSRFNYHGFRYAVIDGLARKPDMTDGVAMMVEPDVPVAGSFECSNKLFNQIHEVTQYTFRTQSPLLALGTGEPREKHAYGDGGGHISGYLWNYKVDAQLNKWLQDWRSNQRADGWFRHTSPAFEDHGGGPAWGGQVTELVRRLRLYYGDKRAVAETYDGLRAYVDYVESKTRDGILRSYSPTEKSEKWRFIGDWVRPHKKPGRGFYMDTKQEREFFNNCYRAMLWQQLKDYAESLGRTDEVRRCREHLATIRPLIHKTFYLADKGTYTFNNQGCLAMALYARIPPPKLRPAILAQLEKDIVVNRRGHLDTGLLGTFIMLDLLIQEGRNDLVALMMGQTSYPGWGYLIREMGLNAWPETWSGWGSQVILVTATPGAWFFEGLAGILPDPQNPGFKHFTLRPAVVKSVEWVRCSYKSPYGRIVSNWKLDDESFAYMITVPPNSSATVYLPTDDKDGIREGGKPLTKVEGVRFLRLEENRAVLNVDSGAYSFASKYSREP